MEERVKVGRIVNTFGIKGEIKIYPYIDYFEELSKVYINGKEYNISNSRTQKNTVIAKFKEIKDIRKEIVW